MPISCKVPLGHICRRFAFWMVAVLFASEHGPYWEVGLVAGHHLQLVDGPHAQSGRLHLGACRNQRMLAVYVLMADQWQYWL